MSPIQAHVAQLMRSYDQGMNAQVSRIVRGYQDSIGRPAEQLMRSYDQGMNAQVSRIVRGYQDSIGRPAEQLMRSYDQGMNAQVSRIVRGYQDSIGRPADSVLRAVAGVVRELERVDWVEVGRRLEGSQAESARKNERLRLSPRDAAVVIAVLQLFLEASQFLEDVAGIAVPDAVRSARATLLATAILLLVVLSQRR